jgi:hypothetical protein
MFTGSFSVRGRSQDIIIDTTQHVVGKSDKIRSYLSVHIQFVLRHVSPDVPYYLNFITAKLKLSNIDCLLSEVHLPVGYNVEKPELRSGDTFNFLLDEKALFIIEQNRGEEVGFYMEFTFTFFIGKTLQTATQGVHIGLYDNLKERANLHFKISKSDWVEKILRTIGYRNLRLVEIPVVHDSLNEAYKDIISEFNHAESYFNKSDYNKCIAHCRHTLDALTRNLKKIKDNTPSETAFKWLENIDRATITWIDELNKSTAAISSKTHLSGLSKDFTRQEAEAIYLVVLGLMNFIGHQK